MASNYESVDRIRRSHRHARPNPAENPAWANCHMDCGVLLAEIDRVSSRVSELELALQNYMDACAYAEKDCLMAAIGAAHKEALRLLPRRVHHSASVTQEK